MATTNQKESVIELYSAYFNRAADAEGANFWENSYDIFLEEVAGSASAEAFALIKVSSQIATAAEYIALYPLQLLDITFLENVYLNLFDRTIDEGGKAFWLGHLNAGTMTRDTAIVNLIAGAKDNTSPQGLLDKALLANKTAVSLYFVDEVKSNDLTLATLAFKNITSDPATVATVKTQLDEGSLSTASNDSTPTVTNSTPKPTTPTKTTLIETNNDSGAPELTSISAKDGTYSALETVSITLAYSENVFVDRSFGSPTLTLSNGKLATYSSGSGQQALIFNYQVKNGDTNSLDLDVLSINLNKATIEDEAGNSADFALGTGVDLKTKASIIIKGVPAPTISSDNKATVDENIGENQVVYTVTSNDPAATYSLKVDGDSSAFVMNGKTGAVTLATNPDFETKASYQFTVIASDTTGNTSEQAVTLGIKDVDEIKPNITSSATATAITENSAAGQVIYTAQATDTTTITYSLKAGADSSAFTIDASSGAVTLTGVPNFEVNSSYSFTVVATDTAKLFSEQSVSLAINDLDEDAPNITSSATANAINENSGSAQSIYTTTSTDANTVNYTLKAINDYSAFSINGSSGVVTLLANPNFTTKANYNFTVVATDTLNLSSEKTVSLAITDIDQDAPNITSGTTATAIDENTAAGQVIYTANATDVSAITYSLKAIANSTAFTINGSSGAVTLTGSPNYEVTPNYNFTVIATDVSGNASEKAVTLAVNNLEENAPTATLTYSTDTLSTTVPDTTTITVKDADILRIFATFNETIQSTPVPTISIDTNIITSSTMTAVNSTVYYYDLNVPTGDKTGTVTIANAKDTLGNVITAAPTNATFSIDNTILAPTFALDLDSGTSDSDGITNDATVNVSLASDVASWEYKLETAEWVSGTDTSFELADNISYNSEDIQVRQTDVVGNISEIKTNASTIKIDTTSPLLSPVTVVSDNNTSSLAKIGDVVTLSFTSDETLAANPTVTIDSKTATVSNTGNNYTATYTLLTGDTEGALGFDITFNDAAGNAGTNVIEVTDSSSVTFDETAPIVSSVTSSKENGTYGIDDVITISVAFDEAVIVTDTPPTLTLETGTDDRAAIYDASASTSTLLKFDYTVQADDTSSDLEYIATNPLIGTIKDAAGNDANLTLPTPAGVNSLSNTKDIVIDTSTPSRETVIFDLVNNKSSAGVNNRTFQSDVDYDIYIVLPVGGGTNAYNNNTAWDITNNRWSGADNLVSSTTTSGDKIKFVFESDLSSTGQRDASGNIISSSTQKHGSSDSEIFIGDNTHSLWKDANKSSAGSRFFKLKDDGRVYEYNTDENTTTTTAEGFGDLWSKSITAKTTFINNALEDYITPNGAIGIVGDVGGLSSQLYGNL